VHDAAVLACQGAAASLFLGIVARHANASLVERRHRFVAKDLLEMQGREDAF
jgi:hypothetical protein